MNSSLDVETKINGMGCFFFGGGGGGGFLSCLVKVLSSSWKLCHFNGGLNGLGWWTNILQK